MKKVAFASLCVARQKAAHPIGGIGIERGGGFVEQHKLGPVDEGFGESGARALPGGEFAEGAVEKRVQVQLARKIGNPIGDLPDAVEPRIDRKILPHRQTPRQIGIGALEIHPRQQRFCVRLEILSENPDAPCRRADEAEENRNGGRLAGAVAAQKRGERSARYGKADAVHRENLAIALDQTLHCDGGFLRFAGRVIAK